MSISSVSILNPSVPGTPSFYFLLHCWKSRSVSQRDRLCRLLLILEMAHQWWEEIAFILSQVLFLWSIRSFFSFSWEKLNVLQGWKPFNSAFNLTWLHTRYHWLSFLFWWIYRQEGSHCKFFNLASTIKMNLNRFRSEAEIFWDQKGKLYGCESWV